jgi:hypothetical protein
MKKKESIEQILFAQYLRRDNAQQKKLQIVIERLYEKQEYDAFILR